MKEIRITWYASRDYSQVPPEDETITSLDDLESFQRWVLDSDDHWVHTIVATQYECQQPTGQRTFVRSPFGGYPEPFLEFAKSFLKEMNDHTPRFEAGTENSQHFLNL